jgi:hypothetical protein
MIELNSVEKGFCLFVISNNYPRLPAFLNVRRLSADDWPPLLALKSKMSTPTTDESTECRVGWLFAL